MTPYVQREIFRHFEQQVFTKVQHLVSRVSNAWGNDLRCHELARAVHAKLTSLQINCARVVDGRIGIVEHSWIELTVPVAQFERDRIGRGEERKVIIDVYCPGRLPAVQLIDSCDVLAPVYQEREPRTDIRMNVIEALVEEMRTTI